MLRNPCHCAGITKCYKRRVLRRICRFGPMLKGETLTLDAGVWAEYHTYPCLHRPLSNPPACCARLVFVCCYSNFFITQSMGALHWTALIWGCWFRFSADAETKEWAKQVRWHTCSTYHGLAQAEHHQRGV